MENNSINPDDNGIDSNNNLFDFDALANGQIDLSLIPPIPLTPIPLFSVNGSRQNSRFYTDLESSNKYKSKIGIVKNSLALTYEFVNKLRMTKPDVKIDFIIINFDDKIDIHSTVELTNENNKGNLINTVDICKFEDIKNVIDNIACRGGTNFYGVEQAFQYLRSNIENFDNINQVKYLMSDGQHNCSVNYPRDGLLKCNDIKFDYSLGIGNKQQYDKKLLEDYAETFIEGIDEEEINNSIIGDTFGTVSLFADNVKINVFTTANEIKSNRNTLSLELNVNFDPFAINENHIENLNVCKISDDICKISCDSSFDFDKIKDNLLFIFCVDISGSMEETVRTIMPTNIPNIPDISSIQRSYNQENIIDDVTTLNDVIVSTDEVMNIESIPEKRQKIVKPYNKFSLETINKFYMYSQEYIICDSTDPVYIELEINDTKYYYLLNRDKVSNNFDKNDESYDYEISLINKYCHLMSKLHNVKKIKVQNDRKTELTSMHKLTKSDDYQLMYNSISSKNEKSQLEIFYITTVNQINKLFSQVNSSHDYMFDNMLATSNLSITRSVSSYTSRQYSNNTSNCVSYEKYDEDMSQCGICTVNVREIIYDCGHCVSCKNCTKIMFMDNLGIKSNENKRLVTASINESIVHIEKKDSFYQHILLDNTLSDNVMEIKFNELLDSIEKKCPVCRSNVKKMKIFNRYNDSVNMTCINDNCKNIAKYVSNNCNHLTYCDSCWNVTRKLNNGKISCKCGIDVTSFIKIIV
jgi:hypothetical protein